MPRMGIFQKSVKQLLETSTQLETSSKSDMDTVRWITGTEGMDLYEALLMLQGKPPKIFWSTDMKF